MDVDCDFPCNDHISYSEDMNRLHCKLKSVIKSSDSTYLTSKFSSLGQFIVIYIIFWDFFCDGRNIVRVDRELDKNLVAAPPQVHFGTSLISISNTINTASSWFTIFFWVCSAYIGHCLNLLRDVDFWDRKCVKITAILFRSPRVFAPTDCTRFTQFLSHRNLHHWVF